MALDGERTWVLVQRLLDELSGALGHPLSLDDAGRCALGFDGGIETLLAADEDGDFLSISTELNVVADEAACRAALALNYGHLPPTLSIALDPASGRLILFGRLPVTGVTSENLVEALAELVTLCPLVCAQLTASGSGEPAFHPELMIRG